MRGEDRTRVVCSATSLWRSGSADHPLRAIRRHRNTALRMSRDFGALPIGRDSMPPERFLRALLLQLLFDPIGAATDRTDRLRYAVSLVCRSRIDDPVWDASTFSKNRDRLLTAIAQEFLAAVCRRGQRPALERAFLGRRHPVGGLGQPKSFRAKDGSGEPPSAGRNGEPDFPRATKNATHASTTDTDARLYRKGRAREPARLLRHPLMENRNGLILDAVTTRASGHAERLAAIALIEPRADRPTPITLGADKAYDTANFVRELREHTVTPHVAQNQSGRRSAIDGRTTRHPGYAISQRIRKRIEEAFGWAKTVAGLRKMRHRGLPKVGWQFTLAMAAYNLVRLPKLLAVTAMSRRTTRQTANARRHGKRGRPAAQNGQKLRPSRFKKTPLPAQSTVFSAAC